MTVVIVVVANKSIDLVFDYCCQLCQRMYTRALKGLYEMEYPFSSVQSEKAMNSEKPSKDSYKKPYKEL